MFEHQTWALKLEKGKTWTNTINQLNFNLELSQQLKSNPKQ